MTLYRCDGPGCEHIKLDTNHWFVIFLEVCYKHGVLPSPHFCIRIFDPSFVDMGISRTKIACGEACLFKIISEEIKHGKEADSGK